MTRHSTIVAALLCAVAATACGPDAVREITGPVAGSQIKFFNFGVNSPGVNFYANAQKMTAISSATSTEATTGTPYGSAGASGLYTAIAPGQYTLSGKIAATTDKDLAVSSLTATLENGKYYSFYQSGFYNTATKTIDSFLVEDPLPKLTDFSIAYVRFVNAISNANPMTLYAKNTVTATEYPVGAVVSYKGAGTFTPLPEGFYDLSTRYSGVTTNAIARTGVSFVGGRSYTITARGDITVTSTTATNRPILDNTPNQ